MTERVGYSTRPRLDKLGVKTGYRVALIGLADGVFMRELAGRTTDIAVGRPRRDTDLVFVAVRRKADLRRLERLRRVIKPNGAIWVLWPKGRRALTESDVRHAALAVRLVDIKVVAFSEELSGLKLVIPVALR